MFLLKVTLKIGQEKYSLLILFWKLTLGHIKWKKIEAEKNKEEVFMKNNCCGAYYEWVIIQSQIVILEIKLK